MAQPTHPQHPDDAHGGAGHGPVEESAEALAERAESEHVVRGIERAVNRPLGIGLALVGAGLALGLLGFLRDAQRPHFWLWTLVAALVACYGLALIGSSKGLDRDA